MALDVRADRAGQVAPAGARRARYLPIAEHGLIGDLHTVALVGTDGTIDWYCCPRFDSPRVFAAILDADHGGLFRISPGCEGWTSKQLYLPDTNVLITRFLMPDGVGEVQDFMPPPRTGEAAHRHRMIRRVVAVRGQMRFVVDVAPRFDYARASHELTLLTYAPTGAIVAAPTTSLPEQLGGARNWDYRYTWMRDAAFTLYALLRLGFTEEAGAFMNWLEGRFRHAGERESGPLQIMYGIDGRDDLLEEELSHL